MPFYVDGTKSGLENFYGLVAASNPKAVHLPGRVTLGAPVTDPETGLTRVEIIPIPDVGYTLDDDYVEYYRQPPVPAAGTADDGEITLTQTDYSQAYLKELIATSLQVVPDDVVIVGYGEGDEIIYPEYRGHDPVNAGYMVYAKANSYIYDDKGEPPFNGTFLSEVDEPLDYAIPNQSLGGFVEGSQ